MIDISISDLKLCEREREIGNGNEKIRVVFDPCVVVVRFIRKKQGVCVDIGSH